MSSGLHSGNEVESTPKAITMELQQLGQHVQVNDDLALEHLAALAIDAYNEFTRSGNREHIDKAIGLARGSIDIKDSGVLPPPNRLNNLGVMLQSRYERTGEMGNLEEAITVARKAVNSTPIDHPVRASRLNNLGNILRDQFERTGDIASLEEAITVARQAVDSTPADHPGRAACLNNLGIMLQSRYERTGGMGNLEEAITVARKAVHSTPIDHPVRASRLNNLGNILQNQFERTGEKANLEEAITVARQAIDATPVDHPDRAGRFNNLGIMLKSRYERTGEMGNLEEAITVARKAVHSTPIDHPDRASRLNSLGNRLKSRYERTGEMADLEEAITVARQATDSTPADHPNHARRLNNLGNMLRNRFERTGEMADLEEAITVSRRAVKSTPVDHPDRATCLNNLGVKLENRYVWTGEKTDLEEAIIVTRQAAALSPANHPDRAAYLDTLGNMLQGRYERTGDLANLEEAITMARLAVDSTPADHPDLAMWLNNLGIKLEGRYERTGQSCDLEEASSCLHAAWSCQAAIPFHRVKAAARCLALLAGQSKVDLAIQLGQAVLDLLPAVNTKLLDRSDQQFVMSTFAGVAAIVCACLLATGQSASAIESLEKGRAVIIGQLVDGRDDLSSLRRDHYDIACRYERLRDEVNHTSGDRGQGTRRVQAANRRRETLAELEGCVKQIREFAGYGRFLLGQTAAEMKKCAQGGTIVVVNITHFRSDAILVSQAAIRTLNLPRLLASDAKAWLSKKWTGQVRRRERAQNNKEYLEYLRWLWDVCVKLVLDAIDTNHRPDTLPRIWWVGTGLGSSMPFHAAGVHSPGSTENALSKAVSSYTPSIKALGYAHRRAHHTESSAISLLFATMPTTPADSSRPNAGRLCDLPGVVTEEKRVRELLTGSIPLQSLKSPSVADVMDQMRHCSVAHFACHGLTDHTDPSNSGLILQKQHGQAVTQDRLTVRQMSELSLSDARIAYLSACSTAENNAARLADEVIHVVSGFQVAGFPHVVGCLWPSIDRVCVEVACGFYQSLLGRRSFDGQAVACALREAVMAVREEDMSAPLVWAHIGRSAFGLGLRASLTSVTGPSVMGDGVETLGAFLPSLLRDKVNGKRGPIVDKVRNRSCNIHSDNLGGLADPTGRMHPARTPQPNLAGLTPGAQADGGPRAHDAIPFRHFPMSFFAV
ncbi:hypothetical protein PCL_09504 [Purpureocillium lilacinum]|uniref:CHAT domain-containing protein n=1 Tax=Purpureocillium lilacinum TaxID=33203 RepID=A0A2U3DQT1_PURLI|nr:hypothetical protein PCL_09504 [Purpureocillium lilacinum]